MSSKAPNNKRSPGDHGAGRRFPELTAREREVLDLIAAGRNNRQIAERPSW
jgi:FixJ family two-component response regulator